MPMNGRVPFGAAHIIGIDFPVNVKARISAMSSTEEGHANTATGLQSPRA
jgi:hypothetical protein